MHSLETLAARNFDATVKHYVRNDPLTLTKSEAAEELWPAPGYCVVRVERGGEYDRADLLFSGARFTAVDGGYVRA